jgi:hypothetical protein
MFDDISPHSAQVDPEEGQQAVTNTPRFALPDDDSTGCLVEILGVWVTLDDETSSAEFPGCLAGAFHQQSAISLAYRIWFDKEGAQFELIIA